MYLTILSAAFLAATQPTPAFAAQQPGQGVAAAASACNSPTFCNANGMPALAAKLRAAGRGERLVHILQIGDSHTAGDQITHAFRLRLQARYGNGGRGVLPAGKPARHWVTLGVTGSETEGWISNTYFGRRYRADGPAIGLAGFTRTAQAAGEWIALTTDTPDFNFDRLTVCGLVGPGQGSVLIRMGEHDESWSLGARTSGVDCKTVTSPQRVARATITTTSAAPVSITSFGTFRGRTGVVMSNLGVGGSEMGHLARTDDRVIARELAVHRPDMVLIAYGTNEGFGNELDPAGYEAMMRTQIARLRRHLARDVPIIVMGAPDAASRNASMGAGCGTGSFTPGRLGQVRDVQRRVARDLGIGFWDWERAMGGRCSTQTWVSSGLMRDDLIHFTREGGDRIASMIFQDLERVRPAGAIAQAGPVEEEVELAAPPRRRTQAPTPTTPPRLSHPGQDLYELPRRSRD